MPKTDPEDPMYNSVLRFEGIGDPHQFESAVTLTRYACPMVREKSFGPPLGCPTHAWAAQSHFQTTVQFGMLVASCSAVVMLSLDLGREIRL